ncbi:MAG: RNA-binding protein [Candidatus Omnitrophica bacterium]|nr:RNA-binding protein [Candidatus Omnitrophota bacterium]
MNIFVGNLSFGVKEPDLEKAFAAFGTVLIAAIVMEKKGKKSRGFGFVEMPDEQEALSAIAALNGKDLLGRPINVIPALPKESKSLTSKSKVSEKRSSYKSQPGIESKESFFRPKAEGHSRHDPAFRRTGRYKEGRRSLSYVKRRSESGVTGPVPERKYKDNPMRWRKKPKFGSPVGTVKPWDNTNVQSKPWQKSESGAKPWQKPEGASKPWQKKEGESKPWQKRESESRPWKKREGASKPWQKPEGAKPSRFKGRSSSVSHKR